MVKWHKILLTRHGESIWNKLNKFTGWYDSKLTSNGIKQSIKLSEKLRNMNYIPNIIYCSKQTRAIDTSKLIISNLNLNNCNLIKTNYLNERHYGNLTGYNKAEINKVYGDLSLKWRKEYNLIPPINLKPLNVNISDYGYIHYDLVKNGESLEMTYYRSKNIWEKILRHGMNNNILVVFHSNTIKSILKNIKDIDIYNFHIDNSQLIAVYYSYQNHSVSYKIEII